MIRKIKDTVDRAGNTLAVFHSDTLANTPAVGLFLKVYAEIVEKGWANPMIPFRNDNRVTWCERPDGRIAGGICYEYYPVSLTGWIHLSFTNPEDRGLGINAICHAVFEEDCKRLGATQLASHVHVDNASRLRSTEKVGLVPQFIRTVKKL